MHKMAKIKNKDFEVEMQLQAIELLNSSLQLPTNPNATTKNFIFNISIESRADVSKKLISVFVHVDIRNDDQTLVLGSLTVSCIFVIGNISEIIKIEADGKLDIPKPLIETLNSISISTTRGVIFSTFKGTFLHGAVLPIIDPSQFNV